LPADFAAERISVSTSDRSDRAPIAMPAAPAFAKEIAVARPTPLEAPVMKIFRPLWSDRVAGSIEG
jgi:hypothetical protein